MPVPGATHGDGLPPELVGWLAGTRFGDVRWFDTIDSTNRYVLDQARSGAPEGAVAVAEHQTAGRGRMGRSWVAPPEDRKSVV